MYGLNGKRVGIIAVLFLLLGGLSGLVLKFCTPLPLPPEITVTPTDIAPTPEGSSGIVRWMHPSDAAKLTGAIWPEGPFSDHDFPRVYATWLRWGDWTPDRDFIKLFHIAELQCGARGDTTSPPICQYLKSANPQLRLFVYMPASFEVANWAEWISWGDRYSCRGYHGQEIDNCDWWLTDVNLLPIDMGWGTQATNCSVHSFEGCGEDYNEWYGDYLAGTYVFGDTTCDWDGIRLDEAGYHKRQIQYPWNVDEDINLIADQTEHGIPWINQVFADGVNIYMADFLSLEPAAYIGGNAMWRHRSMAYAVNPFSDAGYATIVMNEWFPWDVMYEDWHVGGSFVRTCDWECHMTQYVDWIDTVGSDAVWISLGCDYFFTHGQYKAMRFGLGSTMLDDGYFSYQYNCMSGYSNVELYDEYWVNTTTFNAELGLSNLGYCGRPINPAYSLDDGETLRTKIGDGDDLDAVCWYRQFENCLVLTNPTGGTCNFTGLGTSWRHFWGWQAPSINDGSFVTDSENVASQDAEILLFRTGEATPTPTPGNTPTPTPTSPAGPTHTPTVTPTPGNTPTPTPCLVDWYSPHECIPPTPA